MLKKALYFLGGVVVGAVTTYLIVRRERNIIKGKELEDFRRELQKRSEETSEDGYDDTGNAENAPEGSQKALYENVDPGPPPDNDPEEKPHPISRDDWINAGGEYDRETLLYYPANDIFTNEFDQVIDKTASELIGEETLNMFGKADPDDPDAVYAVNERSKTVYEILKQNKTFEMALYGSAEEGM